jgi:Rho GTPase-activating protein 1
MAFVWTKDSKATGQWNSSEQQASTENSNKKQEKLTNIIDPKKIFDDGNDNPQDSLFSQPTSSKRSSSIFDDGKDIDLFGLSERTEEEEREFLIKTFGKDLLAKLEGKASTVHLSRTSRRSRSAFPSEEEPFDDEDLDLSLAELQLQTVANLSNSSSQSSESPNASSLSESGSSSSFLSGTATTPSSELPSANAQDSATGELTYEIDPVFARRSGSWRHKLRKAQNMSDKAWWNVVKQEVAKDDANRRATVNLGNIRPSVPADFIHDTPIKSRVEMWQQRLCQEQASSEQEKLSKTASKKNPSSRGPNESNVTSSVPSSATVPTDTAHSGGDVPTASGPSATTTTTTTVVATNATAANAETVTSSLATNDSQSKSDTATGHLSSGLSASSPAAVPKLAWRSSRPRLIQHSESVRLPAPRNPLQSPTSDQDDSVLLKKQEQQRQEQLRLLQSNQALLPGSRASLNLGSLKGNPVPPTLPPRSPPQQNRPPAASVSLPPPQPAPKKPETKAEKEVREYEYYLNLAKKMDFSDIQQYQMLYQAGVDFCNRPILVVIACKFPAKKMSIDRFLLYCISVMDPIVERDYIIVYIHSGMTSENKLQFSWLRKVYSLFNRKYKKNLKQLFIVQPSFWVKTVFRLFRPFISSKFWKKLVYIEDIKTELSKFLNIQQLKLPEDVIQMTTKRLPKQQEERQMFGKSLTEVMQHPLNKGRSVPIVLEKAVKYLEERGTDVEGIFRLSGNAVRVKEIKTQFDKGNDVDFSKEIDPHVVAGIVKMYLRELPEPLFPFDFYAPLIGAWVPNDEMATVANLKPILQRLPPVNRKILALLMRLLAKIAANPATKMSTTNLSIVFAPNIIKCLNETPEQALNDTSKVNGVMKTIIIHQDTLLKDEFVDVAPETSQFLSSTTPIVSTASATQPSHVTPM